MPNFIQWLSYLDPALLCQGLSRSIAQGVGFETVWPQVLVLLTFATVLMT